MKMFFEAEYRGKQDRISKKGNSYTVHAVESDDGSRLECMGDIPPLERGKVYTFTAEYDPRWGRMKLVKVDA